VLLEGWQHEALKSLAEREGVSVSDLVRRIVSQRLRPRPPSRKGLTAIAAIGRDRKAAGRDHDRWLYGADDSR
jgi:predicted DNA-binding ribbon-helix-helix protein